MSNEFTKNYFQPCVKEFVSTVLLIDDQLEYGEPMPLPAVGDETLVTPIQGVEQSYNEGEPLIYSSSSFVADDDCRRKVYVTDLIKSFSKERLLVTPINPNKIGAPNSDECINILFELAEKADVIILDWDMSVQIAGTNFYSGNELSQKLVERLRIDNKYRLVMIYTADTKKSVEDVIQPSENIGLSIYGKSATTGTDVKDYNELAKQVTIDFLSKKKGLLGYTLLTSLTALRKSTYSMLNTLHSDYDIALLYHRILLSNPDKITDFCTELISDELLSHISPEAISSCLQLMIFKNYITENNVKLKFKTSEGEIRKEVDSTELDELLSTGYKSYFDEDTSDLIAKGKHLDFVVQESDLSKLKFFSYYSSMLSPDIRPNLQLGCVVKSNENYYLCIQPLCDTERLPRKEELINKTPPNFVFLGLGMNSQMDFFIKENDKFIGLRVDYSNVITMAVSGNEKGVVSLSEGNYTLYDGTTLDYIGCLKPMFAQKIANNFAANISRVGIDQFEWLRLKGRD